MTKIKTIKIVTAVAAVLLLAGCDQTPGHCKKYKYSGMVFSNGSASGGYCSMGTLTPSGKGYMTDNGSMPIKHYSYLEFIEVNNDQD